MKLLKIYAILIGLLNLTNCQGQEKKELDTKEKTSNMLIDNLTKQERDLSMMFYLEQAYSGATVAEVLVNSEIEMTKFIEAIPEEKMSYTYGRGKWTVAEVLQHIISYEKIMLESALKIASKEIENPVGYYDQSTTAAPGKNATKAEMLSRFKEVRKETIRVISEFSEQELLIMGMHEWFPSSPRTLVLCISGHQAHHFGVIEKKYL